MAYYVTCPDCGANLDPGEKCDCKKDNNSSSEKDKNNIKKDD